VIVCYLFLGHVRWFKSRGRHVRAGATDLDHVCVPHSFGEVEALADTIHLSCGTNTGSHAVSRWECAGSNRLRPRGLLDNELDADQHNRCSVHWSLIVANLRLSVYTHHQWMDGISRAAKRSLLGNFSPSGETTFPLPPTFMRMQPLHADA
jgi:hypothetical protein